MSLVYKYDTYFSKSSDDFIYFIYSQVKYKGEYTTYTTIPHEE